VRRFLVAVAALGAALILQVTVVNGLPLPGGSPPDLVLLVVVAIALLTGPLAGAVTGFCAGLAADITPPASHLLGLSALVFCLAGYGCGRLRGALERSSWLRLAGVAIGAAAGEALYALVGITFGDPDITWHAVRQVLPPAAAYDVLLSPFVLCALVWLGGYREQPAAAGAGLPAGGELATAGAAALAGMAAAGSAVRDTGSGRGPRLRAAGARPAGPLRPAAWTGGERFSGQEPGTWVHRPRSLRLRLGGGVPGSAAAGAAGRTAAPARLLPTVRLRLGQPRRRDGLIGGPAGAAAGGSARPAFRALPGRSAMGRAGGLSSGWLGGGGRNGGLRATSFSGSPSALAPGGQVRPRRRALWGPLGGRGPRLRLDGGRRGDGLVGGGSPGRSSWGRAARPGAAPGKGAFRTGSFRIGTPVSGGAAGRFPGHRLSGRRRSGSFAAPRFRGAGDGRLRRLLRGAPRRGRGWRRPVGWRARG
jgi:rod shape-determining protein MreD